MTKGKVPLHLLAIHNSVSEVIEDP
jgi:hypothetical protein